MVKVIILSLHDSPRREVITKRLKKRGIDDFEFYNAFDARNMDMSELEQLFDVKKFRETYGRNPARGEIGCTLSHLGIWKYIAESEYYNWIVLEDDAILTPWFNVLFLENNFPDDLTLIGYSKVSFLRGAANNIRHFLFGSNIEKTTNKKLYTIGKNKKENWGFGTVSYCITKKTAKELKQLTENNPYFLTDDFDIYESIINVNHVRPFLVYEDFKSMVSNIEKDRAKLRKNGSRR
ncbi:glycosyltransferase family 25 protein [Vibrio owensii]|uniref:glycosyltransferase family 25 protein n=1 Tax=Vibrio owensii TaxID=696485 RepID=UPI0018F2003E|nr:glycosyltransferase family 25 protein [Vibrio owensii]